MASHSSGEAPSGIKGEPKRVAVVANGRRKIHTTVPDQFETVEEYDSKTDCLVLRKFRDLKQFTRETKWIVEVGNEAAASDGGEEPLIVESATNPTCTRLDTVESFQWRIRNLPYSKDVYEVHVDGEKQEIVVRTTNKKYFKRLNIPEFSRANPPVSLEEGRLTWAHSNNTMVISYKKPQSVLAYEEELKAFALRSGLRLPA
eukprot:GHVU01026225.1.p1 GENE.GHVU01026225.1~~GHVU01026225.1.p1  ORF type:complete len:202 (-),score=30.21 GHVU01026225.1:816-1421(-)